MNITTVNDATTLQYKLVNDSSDEAAIESIVIGNIQNIIGIMVQGDSKFACQDFEKKTLSITPISGSILSWELKPDDGQFQRNLKQIKFDTMLQIGDKFSMMLQPKEQVYLTFLKK